METTIGHQNTVKKVGALKIVKRIAQGFGIAITVLAILLVGFMVIAPRFGWETYEVMSGL